MKHCTEEILEAKTVGVEGLLHAIVSLSRTDPGSLYFLYLCS